MHKDIDESRKKRDLEIKEVKRKKERVPHKNGGLRNLKRVVKPLEDGLTRDGVVGEAAVF